MSHKFVCLQLLYKDFRPEVLSYLSEKLPLSQKTIPEREPLLTMFHTINSSPLLVTSRFFMLPIISINYKNCPVPLRTGTCQHQFVDQFAPNTFFIKRLILKPFSSEHSSGRNTDLLLAK